jgi:hypothetical protein
MIKGPRKTRRDTKCRGGDARTVDPVVMLHPSFILLCVLFVSFADLTSIF